jgi:5'-nucleotidase
MIRARKTRSVLTTLVALIVALSLVPLSASAVPGKSVGKQVRLQILAINDFHGQITPYSATLGGAAYLASYIESRTAAAKLTNTNTWCLGVGDLIGASPAVSGLLQDEPTMQVLDLMNFKYSTVGNHEFDEGIDELYRLQYGGYHPATGDWGGTDMKYLVSNVVNEDTGQTIFPPYAISRVRGVKVGVIGAVTEETPGIVTASGVEGLEFLDVADSVNACAEALKRRGVETIIVLLHDGGTATNINGGPVSGPIVPLVESLDDEIDVVLTAHSHQRYWSVIDGKLVTQAHSSGRAFADIDLVIDRKSGDVVSKTAEIVPTTINDTVMPDPAVQAVVDEASATVAPIVNAPVGTAATDITRTMSAAGESALGNLIADGQKWKMGTQVAFMNPGGIRADLAAGEVTWGELFAIQPFGNYMVTMKMTGAQIESALEQQWQGSTTRMLQISGVSYSWSAAAAQGSKIDPAGIMIGGVPLDPAATYTVTANNFLAEGGDGFAAFKLATDKVYWGSDLDALVDYVKSLAQPFNATIEGRITMLP